MEALYAYQKRDLERLFSKIQEGSAGNRMRLVYQLPTGAGKTRIFAEMVRVYMQQHDQDVVVLTHRLELCSQTCGQLKKQRIACRIISGNAPRLRPGKGRVCYVAMVETLRNRIRSGDFDPSKIKLLIVDEAHHNSFTKLIALFPQADVIGVTATPLSSSASHPMNQVYDDILVGEPIESLIDQGFLSRPEYVAHDVELASLSKGQDGDFTIRSSDALYSTPAMLEGLLKLYEQKAKGKKAIVFNNGIFASKQVFDFFKQAGYPIRHLDHHTPEDERVEILSWFRKTKNALLTSVSMLTTGFDEPGVRCVILYRATTSLTLYHQMIGRGARIMSNKKRFKVIDMGNNAERFGNWQDAVDWAEIFHHPEQHLDAISGSGGGTHQLSAALRANFPNSLDMVYDIRTAYAEAEKQGRKPKEVIAQSIRQHAHLCLENSTSVPEALQLSEKLRGEITYRVKQYGKCLGKVTSNYLKWLEEDYYSRLAEIIRNSQTISA